MIQNNLNAVRLLAASLVLYGHSFIFLNLSQPLFLSWLPLGGLGVFMFFTISGYLITESWDRDPNVYRFFARRALRIFPALIVCVLLSILVLGPLMTTWSLHDYFSSSHLLTYLRNIRLFIVYYLPGVFETNQVPNAVNGSLWSLPVEFLMYIVVAIIGLMRSNRWLFFVLACGSAAMDFLQGSHSKEMVVIYGTDLREVFICGTYFWVGALFYKFNLKRWFSLPIAVAAAVGLLCLESNIQVLQVAAQMLLPLIVLSFGFSHSPMLQRLTCSGDYSYGIYIYAFPIQQTVVYLWPNIGIYEYLAICFTATYALAVLSWHFIESRALSLKPKSSAISINKLRGEGPPICGASEIN